MMSKSELSQALALWEDTEAQMAMLTGTQRSVITEMTDEVLFQKSSLEEIDTETKSSKAGGGGTSKKSDSVKNEHILNTGRDFLDYLDQMESEIQKEKNSHFSVYYNRVCDLDGQTRELQSQVDQSLEVLTFLKEQNLSASTKSNNLHSVCDELMTKMSKLNHLQSEIQAKECIFTETDRLQNVNPAINNNPESLCKMLDEIEECLQFFEKHPNYKDSPNYTIKCQAASSKILVYIKDFFKNSLDKNSVENESSNFDLFYGRLKMQSSRFFHIFQHLGNYPEKSPLKEDFEGTITECTNIFITSRKRLVIQSLQYTLEDSVQKFSRDHCSLVRSASVSLFHLLRDEENLLKEFFGPQLSGLCSEYFDAICVIFYDYLRPKIVKLSHLETLSEIATILKLELMEHVSSDTDSSLAFKNSITQLWEDVQERLVYRAYIFIKSDIQDFSPHQGDLLYPEKLQMMLAIQDDSDINRDSPADIHGMWYPTVRRTLMCLSKLYRSVEKEIFQEISHEALKACIGSIVYASKSIQVQKTSFDGQLFLIKHLLILREQISPFNIIQSSSETALDFSHMKDVFDERSLDKLMPEVKEFQMDYRREVDRLLKATCEQFIKESAQKVVGPIATSLSKLKSISAGDISDKVSESMRNLKKILPIVQEKMSLYLANKETEFILYKPIRVNILETFSKFSKAIDETFEEPDLLVIGCPNIEMLSVTISSLSIKS